MKAIGKNRRAQLCARDGHRCQYCGADVSAVGAATLDHIIPVSLGGSHENANLRTSCGSCNRQKGDRSEGWLRLFFAFNRTKYASVITLEQYHRLLGLGVVMDPLPETAFFFEGLSCH